MVTFKSRNFCFTLNKNAISHILAGKSSIKAKEVKAIYDAESSFYKVVNTDKEAVFRETLLKARLNQTLITIVTTGGSIDIKVEALLSIINRLKRDDDDFHTYIAVSDIVDYIVYKLNDLDIGCVDFEKTEFLKEFEVYCRDNVLSRKASISKSLLLDNKYISSDYLIHYFQFDGKFINKGGKINEN